MKAVIGIGSNLPGEEGVRHVKKAIAWLESRFGPVSAAPPYSTPGEGLKSKGMTYTNSVAEISTNLSAERLNQELKAYEKTEGRVKGVPEIPVDLDLVIYGTEVLRPRDMAANYFRIGYDMLHSAGGKAPFAR